jgi:hypothetical protein
VSYLLNTLILSFVNNIVTIDKTNLHSIVTSLQVTKSKVVLLQTQNLLLHDVLDLKNIPQNYGLVLVHKPIFKYDEEYDFSDSDQQPTQQAPSELAPDSSTYFNFLFPTSREEIRINKHITGLEYGNDATFLNLDYIKQIRLLDYFKKVHILEKI